MFNRRFKDTWERLHYELDMDEMPSKEERKNAMDDGIIKVNSEDRKRWMVKHGKGHLLLF